ncbi:MAG: ScyD/ScyE family protein [Ardenticatenales bacterium]
MHRMFRYGIVLLALTTVLVGRAIVTASPHRNLVVTGQDNFFEPTEITAAPGEAMSIDFVGAGFSSSHSLKFELEAGTVVGTDPASLGVTRHLDFTAPTTPGLYTYYCGVGNHRQLGMTGTLVVGDASQLARAVPVEGSNFKFVPSEIAAKAGEALDVQFKNAMGFHDIVFELDGGRVEKTARIQAGETADLKFNAPTTPGTYAYYCSVGMHRANGMEGKLVVSGPPRAVTIKGSNFKFEPSEVTVAPSEALTVTFENVMGTHDIVFELDGGRVERTARIMTGQSEDLAFVAPSVPGTYAYYCSVGMHRANGMEGRLIVTGAEPSTPPPAATTAVPPSPTPPPTGSVVTPILRDLKSPHGLWVQHADVQGVAQDLAIVSEGGTGTAKPGEFTPGNGDGRVQILGLTDSSVAFTLLDNRTNSVDPAGGVVGANDAIPWPLGADVSPLTLSLLVAQGGGSGQLRPDERAKILKVGITGSPTMLADTLAYETANNPDAGDPEMGGIDSNPWHLVPGPNGDVVYIVDSGANDILKLDPETGALSTWAILQPYEDGAQQAIPTGLAFSPVDPNTAYVTLLGGFASPTGRIVRLTDVNKDGDMLDEDEFHEFVTGLSRPTTLAYSPDGRLYVAELGARRISYVPEGDGAQLAPVVSGVSAITAMAFEPSGSVLISYDIDGQTTGQPSVVPNTVGRIAAGDLVPGGVPTAAPTTPSPTVQAPTPAPTTPPATGDGGKIYLPAMLRSEGFGG